METLKYKTIQDVFKLFTKDKCLGLMAHKGQNGKVGVLGGSIEYTGAPYYAAVSSLRSGGDLAHIFCPVQEAIVPIKSYSPEIIVHHANTLENWMHALHSLVFGPGFGRNSECLTYMELVFGKMKDTQMKLIGDADFLYWLSEGYEKMAPML